MEEPEELKHKDFCYKTKNMTYQVNVKENLVYVAVKGLHTKKDAEDFNEKAIKYLENFPEIHKIFDSADVLVDCSQAVRVEHEARRIYSKMSSDFLHAHVFIVAPNKLIRIILGFLLVASGRKNVKFFKNVKEALAYIRKNKGKKLRE
jgi:hypothetical protein